MKTKYLVCYDIAHPRRLGRVFRMMKGRGIHLQYSVFYCELTRPQLEEIKGKLSALIDPEEDDLRIYPLPMSGRVEAFGQGDRVPAGVSIFM